MIHFWPLQVQKGSEVSHHAISLETAKHQLLRERLQAEYPTLDEETLCDTLEGITDLHEMIAAVIRSALVDEALQGGLRARIGEMKLRLARLEERGAKKRQLALEAMSEVGLKKLEQPDFTASTRAGPPPLIVVSEDVIPEDYWLPQPPKLDRQSLLAALKRGDQAPGAELGNPKPTLAVRTK
jgi:Siphovirus Gp157